MLNSKDRLDEIEELEDDLDDILESLNDAESNKLIRIIIVDLILSSSIKLEDDEKGYLIAESSKNSTLNSVEKIEQLRSSLIKKIKDSIRTEHDFPNKFPIHWIHRLIYSLISKESISISDQVELIFTAMDFCNLPIEALRKKIEAIKK